MKKLHICLALVLVFIMLFGMMSVAAAVGEDDVFTVSLEPTGTKTGLDADIVDAEIGGTVTVDVKLVNNSDTDQTVNALGADILFQTGLSYKSFTKGISGPPGYPKVKANSDNSKVRITFVTNGNDAYLVNLAPGGEVVIGTLTLDVAGSGLNHGDKLSITVDTDSDYTAINTVSSSLEEYPSAANGVVEIVAQDSPSLGMSAPEGDGAEFTVSLVPTGANSELNADIVDAEAGGTVTVDVKLANNSGTDQTVNALGADILFQNGLSYKSFTKGISGPPGYPKAKANTDKSKVRITFVTNGNDAYLVNLAPGGEVIIGTLTVNVADSDLNYGDQLSITVDTDSDYTAVNTTSSSQEMYPSAVNGVIEIITQNETAEAGLPEEDGTVGEGVDETPAQEGTSNDGTGPSAGESNGEEPSAPQAGTEAPSEAGSVFGRTGTMAVIVAAILVIAAAVVVITRKKKN